MNDNKPFKRDPRAFSSHICRNLNLFAAKIVLDEIGTIYDNDTVWKNTTTTTANLTTLLYNLFIRNGAPLFQIGYDIQSRNASDMIVMVKSVDSNALSFLTLEWPNHTVNLSFVACLSYQISLPEHKSIIGDHDQLVNEIFFHYHKLNSFRFWGAMWLKVDRLSTYKTLPPTASCAH